MSQIEFLASDVKQTCDFCPTIFEFVTPDGDEARFRLRHGAFQFETIGHGDYYGQAPAGIDGVCSLDEALDMIAGAGAQVVFVDDDNNEVFSGDVLVTNTMFG